MDNISILIAPDSFKGSLSSIEVCKYLESGIREYDEKCDLTLTPLADGGDGTVISLTQNLSGIINQCYVHDPLYRMIRAVYGYLPSQDKVIIEVAEASGISLLAEDERNPLMTSSFGTGELILDALNKGYRDFIIGLGGSATNDGGIGMLQALGARISCFSNDDEDYFSAGNLANVKSIDLNSLDPRIKESKFEIASDVKCPLIGEFGASRIFGPQKGASVEMVEILEENLIHFGNVLEVDSGKSIIDIPGAGSAGGLGAAFLTFPNVRMRAGFEIISELIDLEELVKKVDLVITGEGSIDSQTMMGKVPLGVARLGKKYGVPVICIAGIIGDGSELLYNEGITSILSIVTGPMTLQEAKEESSYLVENLGNQIIRLVYNILEL